MVKDLDDLLARDHLFDVSVQVAKRCLLGGKKALGAGTRVARVQHNGNIARERDNRELPVKNDEHGCGADHPNGRLNHVGKAVVECPRETVSTSLVKKKLMMSPERVLSK